MNNKKNILGIIIIILTLSFIVILSIKMNNDKNNNINKKEEVLTFDNFKDSNFNIKDIIEKLKENNKSCEINLNKDNFILNCDSKEKYYFNEYEIYTDIKTNKPLYFDKVVYAVNSFYYDDTNLLKGTIDKFLSNVLSVDGLKKTTNKDKVRYRIIPSKKIEVYNPTNIYKFNEINKINKKEEFIIESNNILVNNAFVFYDSYIKSFSLGGNITSKLDNITLMIDIYDLNKNLIKTLNKEISIKDNQLNNFIFFETVDSNISYYKIYTK